VLLHSFCSFIHSLLCDFHFLLWNGLVTFFFISHFVLFEYTIQVIKKYSEYSQFYIRINKLALQFFNEFLTLGS
jgi:hypothetical protein